MSFAQPWLLLPALLVGALLVLLFARLWKARHRHDLVYSDVAFFREAVGASKMPVRILAVLGLGGVLLGCLAAGRPQLTIPLPAKDAAVVLCIDTSGSMTSTDVEPDRARAALAAAKAFIDAAPAGTKIGIVSFATGASVVQPLTAERETAIDALQNVAAPNGATAIGDALQVAAQMLGTRGHRAIVLITDGVNNRGSDPDAVTSEIAGRRIPVFTIGIGTNTGSLIPGTNEEATIDEDALRRYAETTGGQYARAEDAAQLRSLLSNLGSSTTLEQRRVDATLAFALGAALLVVAAAFAYLGTGKMNEFV